MALNSLGPLLPLPVLRERAGVRVLLRTHGRRRIMQNPHLTLFRSTGRGEMRRRQGRAQARIGVDGIVCSDERLTVVSPLQTTPVFLRSPMPQKTVYEARIDYLQILDEHGQLDQSLAKDTLSDDDVKQLYEQMIISREFDEQAFKLQRSGRMGTFPQNKGQEASALGAAKALRRGVDQLVPYYRENPAAFLHGLPMHYVLLFWMGD